MLPLSLADDDDERTSGPLAVDANSHDEYWRAACFGERYFRADRDYEDYAPAYCVGYVGCAQYGGEYEQAERSLCANWERIKGASRLSLQEAQPAFRAAWDRVAREVGQPACS